MMSDENRVFNLSKALKIVDGHRLACDEFLRVAKKYEKTDEVRIYKGKIASLEELMRDLRKLRYQERAFIQFSPSEKGSTTAAACCTVSLCVISSDLSISEVLPLTHFNRIVRGVMLKGSTWD